MKQGLESLLIRLAGLGSTFLLGVLLARQLGPADYGVYGLVIGVSALAMNICLLGTPQLAVREFAILSRRNGRGAIASLMAGYQRASLLAFGALCLAGLAYAFSGVAGAGQWLLGACIALALGQASLLASGLRGMGAMGRGQFMDIVGRPAAAFALALAIWLAGYGLNASIALWLQLVVSAIVLLISARWFRQTLDGIGDDNEARDARPGSHWLKKAVPLGIVDILRQLDGTYALIMMGWLGSAIELGMLRVALAAAIAASMPITILHVVLAPQVSHLFESGDTAALQKLLTRASLAMTAISGVVVALAWTIGRPALIIAFGAEYEMAWAPLLWLCVAQLGFGLFGMGPILLAMVGREKALTGIYILAEIIGIASAFWLIPAYGAVGAGLAQTISLTLIGLFSDVYARRKLGLALFPLPPLHFTFR